MLFMLLSNCIVLLVTLQTSLASYFNLLGSIIKLQLNLQLKKQLINIIHIVRTLTFLCTYVQTYIRLYVCISCLLYHLTSC